MANEQEGYRPNSVDFAIHNTIHRTRDFCVKLAEKMEIAYQVLANKACLTKPECDLTIKQLIKVIKFTGDHQILSAIAAELGHTIKPIEKPTDESLIAAVLKTGKEHGDVNAAIMEAIEDGTITQRELSKIRTEISESRDSLDTLEQVANAVAERDNQQLA